MNGFTKPEKRLLDKSELERRIAAGMAALETGNATEIAAARQSLRFFRDNMTTLLSLQKRADKAIAQMNAAQVDLGRKKLGDLIEGLGAHGDVLAAATKIAESGKDSLLFPRLAATAASVLELVKELKKTTETLRAAAADPTDLQSVLGLLKTVEQSFKDLKDKADQLAP